MTISKPEPAQFLPVLHYKEGIFWKKLTLEDIVDWQVRAEPGGKPDKFGRLKILHM